ncbi:hypothetical protein Hte_006940 [Hypoxylon texense]
MDAHPGKRPDTVKHADPDPIAYEAEVYQKGLRYQRPPFTFKPLEWEPLASERMSADSRGYVLGSAGTGETAAKNRAAFAKWSIVPRRLGLGMKKKGETKKGVFPNLEVELLGKRLPCPIACAPVGVQKIMNPEGELAAARAAARERVPFIMSTASSTSIEDVARASDEGAAMNDAEGRAERWYQLYWPAREHDDITISLLDRARRAGFSVLVVTLDTYILGWRPSDMDNGYNPFLRSDQVGVAIGLTDPVFRAHFKKKHGRDVDDEMGAAAAEWTRTIFPGTDHTLDDVAFLRSHWDGPIVLKGIQCADDARAVAESGLVDGIVVSNHGGRQADGGMSSLGALPGIAKAVKGVCSSDRDTRNVAVLFDSGIRTGADVAKALALGASMCLVGRPYVYGLVLGGEEGVAHVLRSLLGDLELTLHLSGIESVAPEHLNSGVLVREDELFKAQETSVENFLIEVLEEDYLPTQHWTSYLRGRAGHPKFALFADPWKLYRDGTLSLETSGGYEAQLRRAFPIFIQSAAKTNSKARIGLEAFEYKALGLGQVRVLILSPGNQGDSLKGTIIHVPIEDLGEFLAVSYVWDHDPIRKAMSSLETPDGLVLTFGAALGAALDAVRDPSKPILIWADAICIDQNNTPEKIVQIALMSRIFRSARRTIAWIGNEYGNSDDAIGTLTRIWEYSRAESEPWLRGRIPSLDDNFWKAIDCFINRKWFTRTWIVQELVLPPKVTIMCGKSEIDWDDFFEALIIVVKELLTSPTAEKTLILRHLGPAYTLGLTRKTCKSAGRSLGLLELLERFDYTRTTVKRDKLFALLGLPWDFSGNDFRADYESKAGEVALRLAQGFVKGGQGLDMLYRVGVAKTNHSCSWVPNWIAQNFPRTISTWESIRGPFKAGKRIPSNLSVSRLGLALVGKGILFDTVISTSRVRIGTPSTISFTDAFADFNRLLQCKTDYVTGETADELLLRLPIGNARRPQSDSVVDMSLRHRDEDAWPENLHGVVLTSGERTDALQVSDSAQDDQKVATEYWQTMATFMRRIGGSTFCVTQKGYVGLLPEPARIGDEIWLLHGASVPFLMRKGDHGHTLIGECYIHGIMYGEAIEPLAVGKSFTIV